jgi:hypothetical protein
MKNMSVTEKIEAIITTCTAKSEKLKSLRKELLPTISPEEVPGNSRLKRIKKKLRRNYQKKAQAKSVLATLNGEVKKGKKE